MNVKKLLEEIEFEPQYLGFNNQRHDWICHITRNGHTRGFDYFQGSAINATPTPADVLWCLAGDKFYLEQEPESISYEIGKTIEENNRKLKVLFSDEELEEIYNYCVEELGF